MAQTTERAPVTKIHTGQTIPSIPALRVLAFPPEVVLIIAL